MNYVNLAMLIYVGYHRPFLTRERNKIELTNEIFISLETFHFMLFNDFVPEISTQT
jgi:hypothetical protein